MTRLITRGAAARRGLRGCLLSTSTLVALSGFAGSAHGEKIQLSVGGYYYSAFGFSAQGNGKGEPSSNRHPVALDQDNYIYFSGETTLDDGLTVGVQVELEGFTDPENQIYQRYVYLRGGYGELRYGDAEDARILMSYIAPEPTEAFGVNTPSISFNNATVGRGYVATTNSTLPLDGNKAAKLIYFTPSYSGFRLALSYAPDGVQNAPSFGTRSKKIPDTIADQFSFGAKYEGEFDGLSLGVGGGATFGEWNITHHNTQYYAIGTNIGWDGWTVGGSVAFSKDYDNASDDATVFDVGATYALTDAITIGLDWSRGRYQIDGTHNILDDAQLGAAYTLGEGIALDAFIGYLGYKAAQAGLRSTNGIQGGLGTALDF